VDGGHCLATCLFEVAAQRQDQLVVPRHAEAVVGATQLQRDLPDASNVLLWGHDMMFPD
jgi:hypothetical protein